MPIVPIAHFTKGLSDGSNTIKPIEKKPKIAVIQIWTLIFIFFKSSI